MPTVEYVRVVCDACGWRSAEVPEFSGLVTWLMSKHQDECQQIDSYRAPEDASD